MERTASRRPTRQRTPTAPTIQSSEPSFTIPSDPGSPTARQSHRDELTHPSSPLFTPPNPRLSPLPPVLEDASSASPSSSPSLAERRARSHGGAPSDSYVTFSIPPSGSPPGLPVPSPHLKALSSPTLAPPSPLTLSSPLFPSSPSPNPSSRPASPIPLFLRPRSGSMSSRFKKQGTADSPKPLIFPTLTRRASVPDELTLEAEKGQSTGRDSPSPKWKLLGLAAVDANSSSPSLISGKNVLGSPTIANSVKPWKGRSLVGWELKRNGSGNGKLGFGLVRKGGTGA